MTAHEAGLWDDITFVPTYPFKNRDGVDQGNKYSIAAINPLNKVPTLALDDGQVVYGSQTIVECLDGINKSGHYLYPQDVKKRMEAVTRLALADTMFETTVMMVMEGWHKKEEQRNSLFEWIWPKQIRGLDKLEAFANRGFDSFDIGHAAMLHALSYMDFRSRFYEAKDPLYPDYDWTEGRPGLKQWWDDAIQRPSVTSHWNKNYEGDDSAEFCQRQVREVLELQKKYQSL